MGIRNRKTAQEKEWEMLIKAEIRFLDKKDNKTTAYVNQKMENVVPQKLQDTLNLAFYKAFELVFEKGTKVIEKTYSKEAYLNNYKVNEFVAGIKRDRKSMKAFSKHAGLASARNICISGVEGVGLGALGIGIPDIPLFVGMILKSIYEIALAYGYSYDTDEERYLILKMIQTALEQGEDLKSANEELDCIMKAGALPAGNLKEQIHITASTLSAELLYMKFLQGIPIAGIIGGFSDAIYLKRITNYAALKYKRRFFYRNEWDTKKQD